MIYLISGMQRSGTSMVMYALQSGGMELYYNKDREQELRSKRSASKNPTGYWEPHPDEIKDIDFPLVAKGMAVKMLSPWSTIGTMPVYDYEVLIMIRDPREVALSMASMNNGILTTGDWEVLNNYERYMGKGIKLAQNRKDVRHTHILNYEKVLNDPLGSFASLRWPIDVDAAAGTIDSSKKTVRFDAPGDLDDLQTKVGSLEDAVLEGRLKVPEEVLLAAKNGAKLSMVMT